MKTLKLALVGLFAASCLAPVRAEEKQVLIPSLTVVGSSKVSARPDLAQVQVGVVTEAASATKALSLGNQGGPIAEGEQDFGASITVTYALGARPSRAQERIEPGNR